MLEEIGGWDAGYRHYVEDIDLCYRAMRAGWERWYVPAAVVTTRTRPSSTGGSSPATRSGTLRGMARFVRKHPETLARAMSETKTDQYARKAADWSDAQYADAAGLPRRIAPS